MLCGVCEGPKGQQQVIAGTGKYEGMEHTDTSEPWVRTQRSSPRVHRLRSPSWRLQSEMNPVFLQRMLPAMPP